MMQIIGTLETILFSDKIRKVNMFGFVQERFFVITKERVFNVKKNKVKRIIQIKTLGGISKCIQPGKTEFTLHVPSEYDYRFHSDKREEIIEILKLRFLEMKRQNLPIFGINKNNLVNYTTTEKDMKKGQTRFPSPSLRVKEEDLVKEDTPVNSTMETDNQPEDF
mmetsp:Transcript_23184/g.17611  ORF Transcript_23184/g.17611 Transcript_23184/m.17611 type:complete len:165 (+) Transcript_23184:141-635(+)